MGEIGGDPPLALQREYTLPPNRLHTAYGFHLLAARAATAPLFSDAMQAWADAPGWPSWSLGNHDVMRFASRLAHSGDVREIKMLLALLVCLRGTAFLYQGEELGLPQADVPFEALRDPYDIAAWPHGVGRDGARTPMPWLTKSPAAGFSTNPNPWLPVDPAHRVLAIDVQERDPDSVLAFTRRLLAWRADHAALRLGEARVIEADPGVFALERRGEGERLVCVFNLTGAPARFRAEDGATRSEDFLGGDLAAGAVRLAPFASVVLSLPGA